MRQSSARCVESDCVRYVLCAPAVCPGKHATARLSPGTEHWRAYCFHGAYLEPADKSHLRRSQYPELKKVTARLPEVFEDTRLRFKARSAVGVSIPRKDLAAGHLVSQVAETKVSDVLFDFVVIGLQPVFFQTAFLPPGPCPFRKTDAFETGDEGPRDTISARVLSICICDHAADSVLLVNTARGCTVLSGSRYTPSDIPRPDGNGTSARGVPDKTESAACPTAPNAVRQRARFIVVQKPRARFGIRFSGEILRFGGVEVFEMEIGIG